MDARSLKHVAAALGIQIVHWRDDGWATAHCPFAPFEHKSKSDRRPSFFMRASKDRRSGYNCYSCGMSGPIIEMISLLASYRNKNYSKIALDAVVAEATCGVNFEYDEEDEEEPEPLNEATYRNVFSRAWRCKKARKYLRSRNIGEGTSDVLGLLFDPEENRIVFPIRDRKNQLYGFTGRSLFEDDPIKVRDYFGVKKERMLLGANLADLKKPIVLVEGLFAFAAMVEERVDSFASVVASMGAHLSKHQADTLIEWGKSVYCFYDNDIAGQLGMLGGKKKGGKKIIGVTDRLGEELPLYIPKWPKGFADPDELFGKTVKQMMRKARLFSVDKESIE